MKQRVNVKIGGVRMTGIYYPLLKKVHTIKGWFTLDQVEDMQPSDYFEKN